MATSQNATWTFDGAIIPTTWLAAMVRYICYACLGVGMFFMMPIVFLIVLDFFLWVYRTCADRKTAPRRPRPSATPRLSPIEGAASTAAASVETSNNTTHIRTRSQKA